MAAENDAHMNDCIDVSTLGPEGTPKNKNELHCSGLPKITWNVEVNA
jgi:hypothetical protein